MPVIEHISPSQRTPRRTWRMRVRRSADLSEVQHTLTSMSTSPCLSSTRPIPVSTDTSEFSTVDTSMPPLRDLGALPPASARAPRSAARRGARLIATLGSVGLILTAALPGVTVFTDDEAPASAQQQHLLLGALSAVNLDSLGDVSVEQVEVAAKVLNDSDGTVQFPVLSNVTLTDGFGYRSAPIAQFHDAQDFAAPEGTPVQAIASGTVTAVGYTSEGLGYNVTLEHEIAGDTVTSRYGHMQVDSSTLSVGDTVAMGDEIGRVGNTGFSFGAHLHLIIKVNDEAVDPLVFIPKHNRAKSPLGESRR